MDLESTPSSEMGCLKLCTLLEIQGKGWAADHCTTAKGQNNRVTTIRDHRCGLCRPTLCEDTEFYDEGVYSAVHLCCNQSSALRADFRYVHRELLASVEKIKKRADQDLKELWKCIKDPQLREFFSEKSITWRFIVERAAWWGGFWEQPVRSLKMILRKVLGRAKLNFEEMCTILTEAEAIINLRPLTYVHNDVDE